MWRRKAEAYLESTLAPGEDVIHSGEGMVGLKEAFLTLTDKRLFISWLGTTAMSDPKITEIDLRYVISAHLEPGIMTKGPTLVIKARTGAASVVLRKEARKESSAWPKWILEAQRSLAEQPHPSADVAARLGQLADLYAAGALTDEEFSAAKERIINPLHPPIS